MRLTFAKAAAFEGAWLQNWDTTSVTNMGSTFERTGLTTVDLSKWDVSKVTYMGNAFLSAAKFTGTGLDQWSTDAVTTLKNTFKNAGLMNVDVGGWIVSKVTDMTHTFENAAAFTGTGLRTWNVGAVTSMALTFNGASSITSCNKRLVFDAWAVVYDAGWASETCTVRPCDFYIMFTA
jgi:surface protein